jgi:alkylation response protein AidB-like acyl-CoA dehydrogenase
MDFALDSDQVAFQQTVRKFLENRWPETAVRASMEQVTDDERSVYTQMADQLGLPGITIPEAHGGAGATQVEGTILLEEMGRVLYGGPYFATVVLAANALLLSGDGSAMSDLLPAIASGETTATLAFVEGGRRDRTPAASPVATCRGGDSWTLEGTFDRVVDAQTAELVLVVADADGSPTLFALAGGEGLARTPLETMDQTRRLGRLELSGAEARRIGAVGAAQGVLAGVLDRVALALTAEAVGGAAQCVEQTVAHAKARQQFGRTIGSFQAVKHRCADMQVRLEASIAALRYVSRAAETEPEQFPLLASVAKVQSTEAYFRTAADTIQLFGGIGFTWEHFAHLHFKRAKASELMFGSPREHRARIADRMLGPRTLA